MLENMKYVEQKQNWRYYPDFIIDHCHKQERLLLHHYDIPLIDSYVNEQCLWRTTTLKQLVVSVVIIV